MGFSSVGYHNIVPTCSVSFCGTVLLSYRFRCLCIFCIPLLFGGIIGREISSFQCYAWDFSPAKQRQNRNDNPFFMREISLYVRNDRALGFLPTKNVGIEMTFSFLSYRFRCSISEEISPANTSIPHCHIESPLFGVRYL